MAARKNNVVPLKPEDMAEPKEEKRREAVSSYKRRNLSRPTLPNLKADLKTRQGVTHADISIDYPDALDGYRIVGDAMASGDGNFVAGLIRDVTGLRIKTETGKPVPDVERANYALAIIKEIGPRDPLETLLASQMAAIHIATMSTAGLHGASNSMQHKEMTEKSLNRLARTFAAQIEALKRHRSKGEQRVIVERVYVNDGGQAIVGHVEGGGGHAKRAG